MDILLSGLPTFVALLKHGRFAGSRGSLKSPVIEAKYAVDVTSLLTKNSKTSPRPPKSPVHLSKYALASGMASHTTYLCSRFEYRPLPLVEPFPTLYKDTEYQMTSSSSFFGLYSPVTTQESITFSVFGPFPPVVPLELDPPDVPPPVRPPRGSSSIQRSSSELLFIQPSSSSLGISATQTLSVICPPFTDPRVVPFAS